MGALVKPRRVIILGAAGRDFHNFNVFFRENSSCEVVAFTATQIPGIEGRVYPPSLSGSLYPRGIPIHDEDRMSALIKKRKVDEAVFAYSDVSNLEVMRKASRTLSAGADFRLMSPRATMLKAHKPVVSICATRTGSGKTTVARRVCRIIADEGYRVVVIRHPMAYGNLEKQVVQRFSSFHDLDKHECTLEEREEYEPHLAAGFTVFAGVDYEAILREAEPLSDIIVWDGGNNDVPFIQPDFHIVVVDCLRPGHEVSYYPAEVNVRMADVLVLNRFDQVSVDTTAAIMRNVKSINPNATVIPMAMPVTAEGALIKDKTVVVVEDAPSVTHGGMSSGAGLIAAVKYGAKKIVDPRKYATGILRDIYEKNPHMGHILPTVGYNPQQLRSFIETLRKTPCDAIILGASIKIPRSSKIGKPIVPVHYEISELGSPTLNDVIHNFLRRSTK